MTDAHTTDLLHQSEWIRRLALRLVDDPNVADDLVQDTVVSALQRDLVEAVLAPEEPCRTALLLRVFERHSHREIARRMGVTSATVNSRLTRGLARLRSRLDRQYGDRSTSGSIEVEVGASVS